MTWRSTGSLLLCPSTTVSLLCRWMAISVQSPAILIMPAVFSVAFSVDRLIMCLLKPPLAAAVDHIAPHRLFTQVVRMFIVQVWWCLWDVFCRVILFSVLWYLLPAPCSPQSLTAVRDCDTNSILASWDASPGTSTYAATVTGPNGFSETFSTSNLTWSFSGLQCATLYNISVTSQESLCISAPIQTVMQTGGDSFFILHCVEFSNSFSCFKTHDKTAILNLPVSAGPCNPLNLTSILQCASDTATLSWAAAAGAVAYTVFAQEDGSHHYTSCRSNTTSCQLKQLQCGKIYNMTVMAEDDTCNSTGATQGVLMTGRRLEQWTNSRHPASVHSSIDPCFFVSLLSAPCSPSVQSSTLICGNSSSLLSWMPMADATGYVVNASAANGHSVSCSSITASCSLADLRCGETYVATVTARGSQCDSAPGPSTNITTGGCVCD